VRLFVAVRPSVQAVNHLGVQVARLRVAAAATAEQQAEATIGLWQLAPPRHRRTEGAIAGSLVQRLGDQHLPALGPHARRQSVNILRRQCVKSK